MSFETVTIGPCTLIHGDALEVLASMEAGSVDAVVTDPPYGTDAPRDGYGRRANGGPEKRIRGDADLSIARQGLAECFRLLRQGSWCVCFASPKRHAAMARHLRRIGFRTTGEVVWDKLSPGLGGGIRYQHELIFLLSKGQAQGRAAMFSVLRGCPPRAGRHPHEKPLALIAKLMRYVGRPDQLILDPFMGSGTTLVAAVQTGRRAVGIEIDKAYFDVAVKRVERAVRDARDDLFANTTTPAPAAPRGLFDGGEE